MANEPDDQAWDYPVRSDNPRDGDEKTATVWRAWPCAACSQGATPVDFLRSRQAAGREYPEGEWNEFVDRIRPLESRRLVDWAFGCPHNQSHAIDLKWLAQGSEHIVYLEESQATVTKVTLENCYGDFYYISENKPIQAQCTPLMYLDRMSAWRTLLGNAPAPVGITRQGQIVSVQKFIEGEAATSDDVRSYLLAEGWSPVNESWFLWKLGDSDGLLDLWLGDARDENFVKSMDGIIPIDIRLWWTTAGPAG